MQIFTFFRLLSFPSNKPQENPHGTKIVHDGKRKPKPFDTGCNSAVARFTSIALFEQLLRMLLQRTWMMKIWMTDYPACLQWKPFLQHLGVPGIFSFVLLRCCRSQKKPCQWYHHPWSCWEPPNNEEKTASQVPLVNTNFRSSGRSEQQLSPSFWLIIVLPNEIYTALVYSIIPIKNKKQKNSNSWERKSSVLLPKI